MINVLVTGGSGFIGSHLCERLSKAWNVVALVRDSFPPNKWLDYALSKVTRVDGDVCNGELLRRILVQYDIRAVFHLAAQSIVSKAQANPIETYRSNVMGTVCLLQACAEMNVGKVFIQSTDKYYGETIDAVELDPPKISEFYATSKICADYIAQTFQKVIGANIIITRPSNVYGYDAFSKRIVPNTVKACLRNESPIIFTNETCSRQYLYVDDLVDAFIILWGRDAGIYNVPGADLLTQEQVVAEILKHFPNIKPHYIERGEVPEIREQSMQGRNWGWKPKTTFSEGIKQTIEKYREYGW